MKLRRQIILLSFEGKEKSVVMTKSFTDAPISMADLNLVDEKNKIVRLINDGAGSINLAANPKEVKLSYQPRLEAKASGVCTGLICKPGKITLARLARIKGKYPRQIARGETFEGKNRERISSPQRIPNTFRKTHLYWEKDMELC